MDSRRDTWRVFSHECFQRERPDLLALLIIKRVPYSAPSPSDENRGVAARQAAHKLTRRMVMASTVRDNRLQGAPVIPAIASRHNESSSEEEPLSSSLPGKVSNKKKAAYTAALPIVIPSRSGEAPGTQLMSDITPFIRKLVRYDSYLCKVKALFYY
jgi:hypothetical protein